MRQSCSTAEGPLVPQAEDGDAHSMGEEYRGYILDGGGLNGFGGGGHPGGHIRLDPARKEILVEVDRAAVLNNLPAGGIPAVMNGASGVFSNATRGAGIYMYWLMDEVALDLPKDKVDEQDEWLRAFNASRDTAAQRAGATSLSLKTDFIHFLFVNKNGKAGGAGALTIDISDNLDERGSMIAVTDLRTIIAEFGLDPSRFDELLMTAVAHELTHLLFERTTGTFTQKEHTIDPNGNGITNIAGMADLEDKNCLMYGPITQGRLELATVKFFAVVQTELKVRKNQALVLNPNQ